MAEYTIPITKNLIRESQITAQTEDNYSDNIVNSYGELVLAGYDWVTNGLTVEISNPDSEKYVFETIAEVTNEAAATPVKYYIDMAGYRGLSLFMWLQSGATDSLSTTLHGTLDADTAPGSITEWVDIGQYGFDDATTTGDEGSAAYTSAGSPGTNHMLHLKPNHQYKFIKIEIAITGAGDDADYTIRAKKWY